MTDKTRGLLITLFQQVRDGAKTPEQGADTIVRMIEASNRCHQDTQDALMRHMRRAITS
jgi:hypothetical protein